MFNVELTNIANQVGAVASTQARGARKHEPRLVPDSFIVTDEGKLYYLDVSFVLESQKSIYKAQNVDGKVLKAFDTRAKSKVDKYERWAKDRGGEIIPIVVGVQGGMHKQCLDLLSELTSTAIMTGACAEKDRNLFLSSLIARLAAIAAKGNGKVVRNWLASNKARVASDDWRKVCQSPGQG
jgi:hypothetical protein